MILSGDVCILTDDDYKSKGSKGTNGDEEEENTIVYGCGDILGYEYMCKYDEYEHDCEAMTDVEYVIIDDKVLQFVLYDNGEEIQSIECLWKSIAMNIILTRYQSHFGDLSRMEISILCQQAQFKQFKQFESLIITTSKLGLLLYGKGMDSITQNTINAPFLFEPNATSIVFEQNAILLLINNVNNINTRHRSRGTIVEDTKESEQEEIMPISGPKLTNRSSSHIRNNSSPTTLLAYKYAKRENNFNLMSSMHHHTRTQSPFFNITLKMHRRVKSLPNVLSNTSSKSRKRRKRKSGDQRDLVLTSELSNKRSIHSKRSFMADSSSFGNKLSEANENNGIDEESKEDVTYRSGKRVLTANNMLQCSYHKLWNRKEKTLKICLTTSNLCAHKMENIEIKIVCDNNKGDRVRIQFMNNEERDNKVKKKLVDDNTMLIISLNDGCGCNDDILIGINNSDLSQIMFPMNIMVEVGYLYQMHGNKDQLPQRKSIVGNLHLDISDFIMAYDMTTEEFATKWKQLQDNSVKVNIAESSCNGLNEYVERVKKYIHLYHIETMDKEVIASGCIYVNNSDNNNNNMHLFLCLVHCKYNNNGYMIEIRCSNVKISCGLTMEIQQIMS